MLFSSKKKKNPYLRGFWFLFSFGDSCATFHILHCLETSWEKGILSQKTLSLGNEFYRQDWDFGLAYGTEVARKEVIPGFAGMGR